MKIIFNKKYKDFFLLILAFIFLFIYYYLKPKEIKIKNEYYTEMIIAAEKNKLLQEEIFNEKLRRGIEIDKNLDRNETGLIGLEWSGITTTLGDIEAKRTSTNPDFAALLVKLFKEAGLKKGDIVVANFSSSFPALNLAFISAADTLELKAIITTSVGSSTYGGNIEDFTYLDMENYLYSKKLINNRTIAYSLGGAGDIGKEFDKDIIEKIKNRLDSYDLKFFYEENFEKNLEDRYEFYKILSKGNIKAFINIGGNLLSLGKNTDIIDNQKILLDKLTAIKTGLVGKFLKDDIPVFYLLNIKSIALYYNLEFDPDKFSEIGTLSIYYIPSKNFWNYIIITIFSLFIVTHIIFFKFKKNKFIKIFL
ncbi:MULTISPECIES: poly-gamma-glutamate system protein [Fusobacterium]|uniref:poly-gamma-glutamate system protein n=2 Tax=Fusobacteriaceae TaxID=203492 RepID=UPI00040F997A|nr:MULTISPECIES: poly-gamma-glutamate system protein [Fusobacterium]